MNKRYSKIGKIISFLILLLILIPPKLGAFETHDTSRDKSLHNLYDIVSKLIRVNPPVTDPDVSILRTHPWITLKAIQLFENHYGVKLDDIYGDARLEITFGSIEEDIDAVGSSTVGVYNDCLWDQVIHYVELSSGLTDYNRTQNHYYAGTINDNEQHQYGMLTDLPYLLGVPRYSAKQWATEAPENLYRSSNLGKDQKGFRTLGHILHLIEDMGSPAHVRNDNHIDNHIPVLTGKDPYEAIIGGLSFYEHVNFQGEIPAIHTLNLEHIENGSFEAYFDEIANMVQENFFSSDTIGMISYPIYEPVILKTPQFTYEVFPVGNNKIIYLVNENNNARFRGAKLATASLADAILARRLGAVGLADYLNYLLNTAPINRGVIDRECVKDLWKRVAPMLIEYSAGLIAHFYEEFIGPLPTPQGSWLSFIEGNPGTPGDGVFISTAGGGYPWGCPFACYPDYRTFTLSTPISLSQFTDGFTVIAFLSPADIQHATGPIVSFVKRSDPCKGLLVGVSTTGNYPEKITINNVEGVVARVWQGAIEWVIGLANQDHPDCNVTADNFFVGDILVFDTSGDGQGSITTLDAATILNGENAVP